MIKRSFIQLAAVVLAMSIANSSFAAAAVEKLPLKNKIVCPEYPPKGQHLQGIASCGKYIYWVFNKTLVKTDIAGKLLKKVPLHPEAGKRVHGGSPALLDKLYVPYCASGFNKRLNGAPSQNYVQLYDLDLNYIKSIPVPEVEYGAGAVTTDGKHFFIAGGRPADMPGNTIYEYSGDFRLLKKHHLSFNTFKGIQTLAFDGRSFYAGGYGSDYMTYRISRDFKSIDYLDLRSEVGLTALKGSGMLVARIGLDAGKREETFAGTVNIAQHLLNTAVIELDRQGNVFFENNPITLPALQSRLREKKSQLTILRCPENVNLAKIVEIQVFICGKYIIEYCK